MSNYEIDVQLETELPAGDQRDAIVEQVRAAAAATLKEEGIATPAGLAILLTDDERIQTLNREYRHIDRPTDVLSFPMDEGHPEMDDYLGDVAIAVPVAQEQAEQGGHTLTAELALLTIHGVLHLLGYDHLEPDEKSAMWATQRRILLTIEIDVQLPEEGGAEE